VHCLLLLVSHVIAVYLVWSGLVYLPISPYRYRHRYRRAIHLPIYPPLPLSPSTPRTYQEAEWSESNRRKEARTSPPTRPLMTPSLFTSMRSETLVVAIVIPSIALIIMLSLILL
jgi:hypothetical protein